MHAHSIHILSPNGYCFFFLFFMHFDLHLNVSLANEVAYNQIYVRTYIHTLVYIYIYVSATHYYSRRFIFIVSSRVQRCTCVDHFMRISMSLLPTLFGCVSGGGGEKRKNAAEDEYRGGRLEVLDTVHAFCCCKNTTQNFTLFVKYFIHKFIFYL